MSRYVTLCYAMLRYATLRYGTLRYVTLRYATLRYVTLRYATLSYAVLRYATPRYGTQCYAILRYVTLCYAMLGNVTLSYVILMQRSVRLSVASFPGLAKRVPPLISQWSTVGHIIPKRESQRLSAMNNPIVFSAFRRFVGILVTFFYHLSRIHYTL